MSYPCIEYSGYKMSLIEPFTIDDKLITKLEIVSDCYLSVDYRNALLFRVQLNFDEELVFRYYGSIEQLSRETSDMLQHIYDHYCYTCNCRNTYINRECLHMLRDPHTRERHNFLEHLLEDVNYQCTRLSQNPTRETEKCKQLCRSQERDLNLGGRWGIYEPEEYVNPLGYARFTPTNYITRDTTPSWSDYRYYPTYGTTVINNPSRVTVTTTGTSCNEEINRGLRANTVIMDEPITATDTIARFYTSRSAEFTANRSIFDPSIISRDVAASMNPDIDMDVYATTYQRMQEAWNALYDDGGRSGKKIIHTHNYCPTYKKHYVSGENETTTLLLGAEIEVDNGGKSETHAKEVLKIMNGEKTWESEENIFCVHDGSLTSGLEFPTQPGSLAWHKTLPYKKMFEYLDKNGYKAHDTKTCGLHVHINRSFFGEQEKECIGRLMYILEKFNDEFSAIGRRDCRYAKMLGYNGEKCKELYQKGYTARDKYNAINLLHKDTIEIRSFKGTLKYSTYINTLEFVSNLAHFVKEHTDEEIENMKWLDLYETFSKDLKMYYNERAEIEKQKKGSRGRENI